ncbi:MAG TPA: hypothetical protein VMT98_18760 [Verrucomicrobiae bacterium]|jgi:hypothetical protein|nr:hypothetical protein [Verrucomicrobiae bacterium]
MANTGKWVVGGVVSLLGVIGLFLAANAKDNGIYLFGFAIAAFAIFYVFAAIKQSYDQKPADGRSAARTVKTA